MNTVVILEHEQLPEEKLEGLKLFLQCHEVGKVQAASSAARAQVMRWLCVTYSVQLGSLSGIFLQKDTLSSINALQASAKIKLAEKFSLQRGFCARKLTVENKWK